MNGTGQGTPRARALGAALRKAREDVGLNLSKAAARLGMPHGTLSRYETGTRFPKLDDVSAILEGLEVDEDVRNEILHLAHGTDDTAWLAITIPDHQRQLEALLEYERVATKITEVAPVVIPGLLQTADYARAIMERAGTAANQITTRVAVRLGRRDALTRNGPAHLLALIGEPALRKRIGGHRVMAEQLRFLLQLGELPTVDIRVVPAEIDWHPGDVGPFVLDEMDDLSVVLLEIQGSGLFLHTKDDVARYEVAAEKVLREAMTPARSAEVIAREASRIEETIA